MGWSSVLKGISKGLGGIGSSVSKWLQGTKWGNWLKVGAGGGVLYVVYDGWNSLIGSVSDATGLSEDNVGTLFFLVLGCLAAYLIVSVIVPRRDSGGTVVIREQSQYRPYRHNDGSRYSGSSYFGYRSSGSSHRTGRRNGGRRRG